MLIYILLFSDEDARQEREPKEGRSRRRAVVGVTPLSIILDIIAIKLGMNSLQDVVMLNISGILIDNAHRLADWLKKDRRGPVAVVSIVLCVIIAIMLDMLSLQTVARFLIEGFIYGTALFFGNWTAIIIINKLGI